MKDNPKILILLIFNFLFIIKIVLCEGEKTCIEGPDQTCEYSQKNQKTNNKKINDKKDNFDDLKYSDYFLKQPVITKENINTSNYNSSKFLDLSINTNILNYIRDHGVIPYPHKRFKEKQQGNFLHFMHLAYEKKLPVYFTIDQIIYPYIEITKQLIFDLNEFVFFPIYKSFLDNIVDYGLNSNYNKGITLFFSLSLKFLYYGDYNRVLNKKVENLDEFIKIEKISDTIINDILDRSENDTNILYNFTLFGLKRSINKFNFVKINKNFKKGNIISQKITNSLRFFQEFVFDASKELYNIYLIGKIIEESGQEKLYYKIKKYVQYLFNEDEENMDPVEIYHYINDNYKGKDKSEEEINELYEKIKKELNKPKKLKFLEKIDFIGEVEKKLFYEEKNKKISLFSYSSIIEDWVNNKMINFEKGRIFPSVVEFIDIAYDGKMARSTLEKRFNAKEVYDKMFLFRDGIDMTKELNQSKKLIEKSLKEEKKNWMNSYENSFNYLLNLIGQSANEKDRNSLIKSFNTILGSYIHFKEDILLIQQYSNITYAKNGQIPDIHFENNTKFYNGIKELTSKYREEIINMIECLDNKEYKEKVIGIVDFKLDKIFKACDKILDILNNNKTKSSDILSEMFFYDRRMGEYRGWYVDLFRNNNNNPVFNLDIYAYNFYIAHPIKQIEFEGVIVYEAMNYPEIGLIAIDNEDKKSKKLYLFSSYTGNEYPHPYIEKVDFKGLQESIISRKY